MSEDGIDPESLVLVRQRGPGRNPISAPPLIAFERELAPEDIDRINSGEQSLIAGALPVLEKIKFKHHLAARLLGEGLGIVEVSLATGYAPNHIVSSLMKAPAFAELVNYYKQQRDAKFDAAHQALAVLGMTAIERLQERLDDDEVAVEMSPRTLMDVAEMALERSVAPKKSEASAEIVPGKGLVVNLNFAEPAKPTQLSPVIDIEANSVESPAK